MSQENKNYFDLCNDVLEELYYETVDTFEELADLPEGRKVKKELNRALVYICNNEQEQWKFRDCDSDLLLVPYMSEYDLPNGFIKYIKYPKENLILMYNEEHKYFPINKGKPLYYWFDNNKIKLYPTPTQDNANEVLRVSFFTYDYARDCRGIFRAEMVEACDTPIIPNNHRNILVYRVCADWRASLNDPKAAFYEKKYKEAYRSMLSDCRMTEDYPNGLSMDDVTMSYKDTLLSLFRNPYTVNSRMMKDN